MHTRRTTALLAALALGAWTFTGAIGATYYVRIAGNNASAGTSPAAAWRTIDHALETATASDTIYVGAGTYTEQVAFNSDGTAGSPIRLIGDTNGSMTGDAGVITLMHSTAPVLRINGDDHIHISGITISGSNLPVDIDQSSGTRFDMVRIVNGSGTRAIDVRNADLTMTGGEIASCSSNGMTLTNNGTLTMTGTTIRDCGGIGINVDHPNSFATLDRVTIRALGGRALYVRRGTGTLTNSIIRDNGGSGVHVNHAMGMARVCNNVFYILGGAALQCQSGALNAFNNITVSTGTGVLRTGGTVIHGSNLYWGVSSAYSGVVAGTGDLLTNPLFADTTEFRHAPGAPVVDAGTTATGVPTADRDGATRPSGAKPDIGLYESGSSPAARPRVTSWLEVQPQ